MKDDDTKKHIIHHLSNDIIELTNNTYIFEFLITTDLFINLILQTSQI